MEHEEIERLTRALALKDAAMRQFEADNKRLSAEVEETAVRYEARARDAQYFERRVCELKQELAALRAQIAEAQPVGEASPNAIEGYPSVVTMYREFDEKVNLYLHPADAKDAERYRWLRDGGINSLPYEDYGAGPDFDLSEEVIDAAMQERM